MNSPITSCRILGVDPGYDRIGWCVADTNPTSISIQDLGCIYTTQLGKMSLRYLYLIAQLQELVGRFHPTEAALESLFFAKNTATALRVSEARGLILSTLLQSGITCFEYTPLEIKQAVTGYGRADKKAVERMMQLQLGEQLRQLGQKYVGVGDDAIDAMAVTVTHRAARQLRTSL